MPKAKNKAELTAKEREQYFVYLYLKQGADESKIAYCEKRAALKPGSGKKILSRVAVKKEIAFRMAPVQAEQVRQQTIVEAADAAKEKMQQELALTLASIKLLKLDPEVLEGRLMQGVIGIDIRRHPDVLLEFIKAGYVLNGSIQSGNTKRLTPSEENKENPAATVYRAIFSPSSQTIPASPSLLEINQEAPPEGASPLYPDIKPPVPLKLTANPLPAAGESLEEISPRATDSTVITVEIG